MRRGIRIGVRQTGRDEMRFFAVDFIRTAPIFFPETLRIKAVL
jgi:hypothetical protein